MTTSAKKVSSNSAISLEAGSRPPGKIAILADDLTGCLDAAAAFARAGHPVRAGIPTGSFDEDDALLRQESVFAIDTESRGSPDAGSLNSSAAHRAITLGASFLYKKIDSTLRGPLEEELDAVRTAVKGGLVLVCPAVPSAGRTTLDGVQRLRGEPLPNGDLAARLAPLPSSNVALSLVRQGPGRLREALEVRDQAGDPFAVVDALEDVDLEIIAAAILSREPRPRGRVVVGAAGLAQALARALFPGEPPRVAVPRGGGLPLVVTSSFNAATREQIAVLEQSGRARLITIPLSLLLADVTGGSPWVNQVASAVADRLVPVLCTESSRNPSTEHYLIAHRLADIAATAVQKVGFKSLVLSGGDTSFAVLRRLGARVLETPGMLAADVPAVRIVEKPSPLTIATKSGGFGTPTTLLEVVETLYPG